MSIICCDSDGNVLKKLYQWDSNQTPFASNNEADIATLYVPSALISSYQSASNWATILARAGKNIAAIEGSIYETQYADGTPIA